MVWSVLFSLGMVEFGSIPPGRGFGTDNLKHYTQPPKSNLQFNSLYTTR